ncbi:hypothetical protein [Stappia sp. WLB 29]|uniref:hypothetical protein n=1 Tax=Stappia sp. WLB 29 TaxID=2925220 RepID=UPI0020BDD161|nr:hypothetical protein [Stappia sp. WLB 29]
MKDNLYRFRRLKWGAPKKFKLLSEDLEPGGPGLFGKAKAQTSARRARGRLSRLPLFPVLAIAIGVIGFVATLLAG